MATAIFRPVNFHEFITISVQVTWSHGHKLISWVTHFAMITSTKENSESDADSLLPGTKTAVFKHDYMFTKAAGY